MWKLRKLKKEIETAHSEAEEAVQRAEREKRLQQHLAGRLRAIQIELDVQTRGRGTT